MGLTIFTDIDVVQSSLSKIQFPIILRDWIRNTYFVCGYFFFVFDVRFLKTLAEWAAGLSDLQWERGGLIVNSSKEFLFIKVFRKEEAANYSQRSYDQISYVWHTVGLRIASVGLYRLNHISESAELDIFQELIKWVDGKNRWIWEQGGLPKLLPENTDGEVGWRSEVWNLDDRPTKV